MLYPPDLGSALNDQASLPYPQKGSLLLKIHWFLRSWAITQRSDYKPRNLVHMVAAIWDVVPVAETSYMGTCVRVCAMGSVFT